MSHRHSLSRSLNVRKQAAKRRFSSLSSALSTARCWKTLMGKSYTNQDRTPLRERKQSFANSSLPCNTRTPRIPSCHSQCSTRHGYALKLAFAITKIIAQYIMPLCQSASPLRMEMPSSWCQAHGNCVQRRNPSYSARLATIATRPVLHCQLISETILSQTKTSTT